MIEHNGFKYIENTTTAEEVLNIARQYLYGGYDRAALEQINRYFQAKENELLVASVLKQYDDHLKQENWEQEVSKS